MLIKEFEDMLELIKQLPSERQLKCARTIWLHVEEWEERQQHPHLSDAEFEELQSQRAAERHLRDEARELEECGMDVEPRSGVVETFDRNTGQGLIRMEDGEQALLHIACLRACGYRHANEGASVEFLALRRSSGWQAYRILMLTPGDRRAQC